MSRLDWFAFYPADWRSDVHVQQMTMAQRGIYIELLAMAWQEGGRLPSDTEVIRRRLRCRGRWVDARKVLDRFVVDGQYMYNRRMVDEIKTALRRVKDKSKYAKFLWTDEIISIKRDATVPYRTLPHSTVRNNSATLHAWFNTQLSKKTPYVVTDPPGLWRFLEQDFNNMADVVGRDVLISHAKDWIAKVDITKDREGKTWSQLFLAQLPKLLEAGWRKKQLKRIEIDEIGDGFKKVEAEMLTEGSKKAARECFEAIKSMRFGMEVN